MTRLWLIAKYVYWRIRLERALASNRRLKLEVAELDEQLRNRRQQPPDPAADYERWR